MSGENLWPVQYFTVPTFYFEDGSLISPAHLAYLDINRSAQKTALIITSFRGRLQSTLTFAEGVLSEYRILVAALFGNGESLSPSNSAQFPGTIDYRDCVRMQRLLLTDKLNIQQLDVIIGFSMGGQCTYYWTVMYPDFVKNAIVICSSAQTSRHNYQFLEGPKAALENSVDYVDKKGDIKSIRGLHAFGKAYSAWLTSAEWFEQELYFTLGYKSFQDWDYHVAGKNYDSWHPDDLLSKMRMWQEGDITKANSLPGRSLDMTLSSITARVLIMPCRTDQYFRWEASRREAALIPHATLKVIPSVWGHLAGFGINKADTEWMDKEISDFLER